MTVTRVAIVRHAQAEKNVALNEKGEPVGCYDSQTQAQGGRDGGLIRISGTEEIDPNEIDRIHNTFQQLQKLGFFQTTSTEVLVSPLRRARETAEILCQPGQNYRIVQEEKLKEVNAGTLEGCPVAIDPRLTTPKLWELHVRQTEEHGGESYKAVKARLRQWVLGYFPKLQKISHTLTQTPNRYVVLVTHGTPSRALLDVLGQPDRCLTYAEAAIVDLVET